MTAENQDFQPPFTTKESILQALQAMFNQWEDILRDFDDAAAENLLHGSNWNMKDVIAHLMAWQQVTNARIQAGLNDTEPVFPGWLDGSSPESEEEINIFNNRIKQQYHASSWADFYQM